MERKRRNLAVYGLLLAVWALVIGWQAEEHQKVKESARTNLRRNSKAIANTVGAFIRGLQFHGTVFRTRLEPALKELVNGSTNEIVKSGDLISISLLNAAGETLASAGKPMDLAQADIVQQGERWGPHSVTMVYPIEGATVLPPFHELTNSLPEGMRGRGFPRHEGRPEGGPPEPPEGPPPPPPDEARPEPGGTNTAPPPFRDHENRPRRPFWARGMDAEEYQNLIKSRELHGLVLTMSTESLLSASSNDLWLRWVISFFAGVSALGVALAWRNLAKSSELQIRLVRASELNTHLREMNLAAAGLAHETRNPLNIIRGLAQMISKQPGAPSEIKSKSREIVDETDKVTAQLNEFINYSRPRELRPAMLAVHAVAADVARALSYDLDEKKIQVNIKGEPVSIQADEQMLRQVLFNLVLNAVQAVPEHGEIEILTQRQNASVAVIEVKDNGPGVPAAQRSEIFKPYFTMQQKGTGLGLAIVQQIVQAHGWEIQCLANEPSGARFRITHIKLAPKH